MCRGIEDTWHVGMTESVLFLKIPFPLFSTHHDGMYAVIKVQYILTYLNTLGKKKNCLDKIKNSCK